MPVKYIIPGQKVAKEKLQRAKELRRDMTPAEKVLWQELHANKLGVNFRPPPASPKFDYINLESASRLFRVDLGEVLRKAGGGGVDFYCHKVALVIEVDGDIHDLQKEDDTKREMALSEMGLRIIHFSNNDVLKNSSGVVEKIKEFVLLGQE